ncbi:ROK family transcriptional regulator [Spongiactinospora sp. TRM90649]|uniref:ROK family transcriptional regulator n=1 Tax=Spongiactinospora sp. TRM90649 TaxID=3031114 RepID=UPI0023F7B9F7|nr:ROK family transcriptional regulator [Spongiactinospora sp. TRM90649]MDF5754768.1 ROK family transcriptional regulator [Spongiactinospora sp. TRM90649]
MRSVELPPTQRHVLSHTLGQGSTTRPRLLAATGLSKPSVNDAVSSLEAAGYVRRNGRHVPVTGKPAVLFEAADEVGWALGIDLGGSHVELLAVDLAGVDATHVSVAEPARSGAARRREPSPAILEQVAGQLAEWCGRADGRQRLRAVTIAVPQIIDAGRRQVSPADADREQGAVAALLRALADHYDGPVRLENNVNCSAVAEMRIGAGAETPSLAYLQLGVGVGAGIITEGRLVRGAHGAAGELSRLPYPWAPDAPEQVSRYAMEDRLAASRLADAYRSRSPEAAGFSVGGVVRAILAEVAAGSAEAGALLDEYVQDVARACVALAAVTDPDIVVIGGEIGDAPEVVRAVQAAARPLHEFVTVTGSVIGALATVLGAAILSLEEAHGELLGEYALHAAPAIDRLTPGPRT